MGGRESAGQTLPLGLMFTDNRLLSLLPEMLNFPYLENLLIPLIGICALAVLAGILGGGKPK
jgi:hypothetical protein